MLSKKCKYAIHALVYLAERYQEGPVHIQEIAEKRNIPKEILRGYPAGIAESQSLAQ